jgi:hypothetical protein
LPLGNDTVPLETRIQLLVSQADTTTPLYAFEASETSEADAARLAQLLAPSETITAKLYSMYCIHRLLDPDLSNPVFAARNAALLRSAGVAELVAGLSSGPTREETPLTLQQQADQLSSRRSIQQQQQQQQREQGPRGGAADDGDDDGSGLQMDPDDDGNDPDAGQAKIDCDAGEKNKAAANRAPEEIAADKARARIEALLALRDKCLEML